MPFSSFPGYRAGFPVVEAFGSFTMDLFTAGSDLDLSINFSNDYTEEFPRDKKIAKLRKFKNFLYQFQSNEQSLTCYFLAHTTYFRPKTNMPYKLVIVLSMLAWTYLKPYLNKDLSRNIFLQFFLFFHLGY